MVDNELGKIKGAVTGNYVPPGRFYKALKEANEKCLSGEPFGWGKVEVNKRILVAHSGFQEGIVEVMCPNGEPASRYRTEALGQVGEAAKGLIKELFEMLIEAHEEAYRS